MIKCSSTGCVYGHCCVDCDAQKSKGNTCDCYIAEDLNHDREEILKYCTYATESKLN